MPVKTKSKVIDKKITVKAVRKSAVSRKTVPAAAAKTAGSKKVTLNASLSVPVFSLAGRTAGTLALPKEIFGQKVNKSLLSQAMRVYLTNQKHLTGSTKTRGEVVGSTAKIYRQKGTGRARHGAIRAPIFVGGGIVFGPKPRKVRLSLPQKMKQAALISALSVKLLDKNVVALSGIEKASGKTKEIAKLMGQVSSSLYQGEDKKQNKIKSVLIVLPEKMDNVARGARNIPGVSVLPANLINAYEVLRHEMLVLTKDAVEKIGKGETKEQK